MSNSAVAAAQAFVRAINRQDVDAMAQLITAGHRFTDSLGNVIEGRDKIRAAWDAYFHMVPDYSLAVEEFYVNGPAVVMLGIAAGTYSSDGSLAEQNRWKTPAAVRAIVDTGQIAEWQVYADNEPIRRKMAASEHSVRP